MNELTAITEAVRELRIAHRSQWLRMFKPFGWEIIDIRYGGVISRLDTASVRIMDYVEGRIARIEELEQERCVQHSKPLQPQRSRLVQLLLSDGIAKRLLPCFKPFLIELNE